MRLPSGVFARGSVFWCRVVIPKDLRHLYPRTSSGALATTHSCVSLQTSDRDEARVRGLARRAQVEGEFLERRKSLKAPSVRPAPPLQTIIADAVYAAEMAADEGQRADKHKTVRMVSGVHVGPLETRPDFPEVSRLAPLSAATTAARTGLNQRRLQFVRDALASGNLLVMIPIADKAAKALGLNVDWDSDEGASTLEACLRSYLKAREAATQRDAGAVIETPEAPEAPKDPSVPPGTPVYLRDVVANWKAKSQPKFDAVKHTERALFLLDESGLRKPVNKLTRPDGARLRDWLRSSDRTFKQKTGLNYWTALQTLLNVAAEYGQIDRNPWEGLDFEVTNSKKREEFTREELISLFGSELFTKGAYRRIYSVQPWDAYFMMLFGLWTGARIGELGQLEIADVIVENGIQIVSIHEETEGSTVKNTQSIRKVPVAPEVLRVGFMDYVADLKAAKQTKLFPSLHRGGATPPGEVMGEWFRGYRKDLQVSLGRLNGFHRFRHTIRSVLAEQHIGPETADALTGHASRGSTGSKDYTHIRPRVVLDALKKPLYPFLDLPRVYPTRSAS